MWIENKYITLMSSQLGNFKKKGNVYNFRCPYCGDSKKDKFKARGYFLTKKGKPSYYCHNCGISKTFKQFLQDNNAQLYQEYSMEILKEKGNLKEHKEIDIKTPEVKESFPEYLRGGSPLRKIKKISQLDWDHPAKTYVLERKIPNPYHAKLYYCPRFYTWTNSLIPNKFKDTTKDEPRLIIPFIDENNKLFGYQGRSFDKKSKARYITLMLDESKPKVFGLDGVDFDKKIYAVEGPLDSCFVKNCIAMAGSDISFVTNNYKFFPVTMVYDNEPRSIEIVKKIKKAISNQQQVVIWPENIKYKDINDMILGGMSEADVQLIIEQNTYKGLEADMALVNWRKC